MAERLQRAEEIINLNGFTKEELIELESLISNRILDELGQLPNGDGNECRCKQRPGTYEYVHYGHFMEIISVCVKCGGLVSEN